MITKPPQLTAEHASAFTLPNVVDHYHLRTPYPANLPEALLALDNGRGGPVLELGCGTGEITRRLAPHVSRIDAVDISAPMLRRAAAMPGGDATAINWVESPAETFEYAGPYSLAVAGDSLHWMEWEVVLPAIGAALLPGAALALVTAVRADEPWDGQLLEIIQPHSIFKEFEAYNLPERLAELDLWSITGGRRVGPTEFTRTIDDFVESLHATGGLPRDRMSDPEAFDAEVRALLASHASDGVLNLRAFADITSGQPSS